MSKMVTRSVIGTEITAKVVNKNTDEVTSYTVVVSKLIGVKRVKKNKDGETTSTEVVSNSVDNEKAATKELVKVIPEELVIIKIESMTRVEKLYGVDQQQFMDMAVELDPVTRKPLTNEN